MIFKVYVVYNRKIEAYERPIFSNYSEQEMVEACIRDYRASTPEAQAKMKECSIYSYGTYDDCTAKMVLTEPNLIFNFNEPEKEGTNGA